VALPDSVPASKKDVETIVEKAIDILAHMLSEDFSPND
jgi:hypothetical protein